MGRKRKKNTSISVVSKKCKVEQLRYGWAKFPGFPYWPVQVVDKEGEKYIVYVKSDNALLKVKCRDTIPFLKYKIVKKVEGIADLSKKRKNKDLEAFEDDFAWVDSTVEIEGEFEAEEKTYEPAVSDDIAVSIEPAASSKLAVFGDPEVSDQPAVSNEAALAEISRMSPASTTIRCYEGESEAEDKPSETAMSRSSAVSIEPTVSDDPVVSVKPASDESTMSDEKALAEIFRMTSRSISNREYEGGLEAEEENEPVVSSYPVVSNETTVSGYPVVSGEPMMSDEPAQVEISRMSPTSTFNKDCGEPTADEKDCNPVVSREPALSDEPMVSDKPTVSDEPMTSGEPILVEIYSMSPTSTSNIDYEGEYEADDKPPEPAVSRNPAVSVEPTLSGDPVVSGEPAVSDEPALVEISPRISPTSTFNKYYVPDSCSEDELSDIYSDTSPMFTAVKLSGVQANLCHQDNDTVYDSWHEDPDDDNDDPDFIPDSDLESEDEEESLEKIVDSVIGTINTPEANSTAGTQYWVSKEINDNVQDMFVTSSTDMEKPLHRKLDEQHKLHDLNVSKIYVKMYQPSDMGQKGEKKDSRPYDTVHACKFCFKLYTHIQDRLQNKHRDKEEVKNLVKMKARLKHVSDRKRLSEEIKKCQDFLRQEGDHLHNRKVCFHREGELLVQRKGSAKDEFDHTLYGPCPDCLMWVMRDRSLQNHQQKCAFAAAGKFGQGKKSIKVTLSKALSGQEIVSGKQSLVTQRVLPMMRRDSIFEIVQNDKLIIELGEMWMIKSYDNKLKRCKTASFRMRLGARLLDAVRRQIGNNDLDMLNLISPVFFDDIVQATMTLCQSDAEFQLKTPSVGLKIGYDLGRLAGLKICHCIKNGDAEGEDDAKKFVELMKINWSVRISKFAHISVKEKHYSQHRDLPHPEDIKLVAESLVKLAETVDMSTRFNYHNVVKVVLPRLMVYNRRRSGEIEALTITSYLKRTQEVDDVEEALLGELSSLEKHLLESQQLMWIRGKQGKRVPVLIPSDAHKGLEYICNEEVRRNAGIKENSPYLFANRGHGVYSALQCLKDCCQDASLKLLHPERLTSTGYRAYMATIAQCVGLKNHEVQWLCNHLGHTEEVHKTHYRHTLEGIERIQLGKLLLLQDKNMLQQCKGKSLDDIQFDDIVDKIDGVPQGMVSEDIELVVGPGLGKSVSRQKWTESEESELKILFSENLSKLRCPKTLELKAAVSKSKQTGGCIHLRKPDNIKKKVSNMIVKLRKN